MRILVLSSLAENSGCHLRARYLSEALRRQGHDVLYVRPLPGLPLMLDFFGSFVKYTGLVLWKKFDFGFCIKPYPNALLPLLFKRLLSRSIRIGTDIDDMDHGYRTGLLPKILRSLQRPLPRLCDIVTCHNDALEKWIPGEYRADPEKIHRLDQGVDLSLFHPVSATERENERAICRQRWTLPDGKILVYTAHLNIASDLDVILKAFSVAAASHEDLSLLVAGGGPLLADFRRLADRLAPGGRVFFTGPLPPEEIRTCAYAADFCLVYYKDKPVNLYRTSMKIRECLAMARPVIANDVGDLKEFREFVYPAGTGPEAFAAGILSALKRPGPDGREDRGAQHIRERYDWDQIACTFSKTLETLVSGG